MNTTEGRSSDQSTQKADLKLEVVVISVSDVDRAKQFYGNLGWRLDADFPFDNGFRVVQFTPPGSGGSVQFGTKITSAAPGSAQGTYLVVSDIEAARDQLVAGGADVSEVFHAGAPGAQFEPDGSDRVSGRAPGVPPTAVSRRSAIRTATAGSCKRSRPGCPAGSTPLKRRSHPGPTWRAPFGGRRTPMPSTSSAPGSPTRIGLTGMPHTWWRSRPARICPREAGAAHSAAPVLTDAG